MNYETGLSLEERVASLFQPDTLLPAQYFETFRRKANLEPEKRLMLAVLEDAIACYQKYATARDSRGKALFREAEEWVLEENTSWLFSFENTCDALGFNPKYVRQGLKDWKEARLTGRPRAQIYRLSPRKRKAGDRAAVPGGTGQRMLKAAGR